MNPNLSFRLEEWNLSLLLAAPRKISRCARNDSLGIDDLILVTNFCLFSSSDQRP